VVITFAEAKAIVRAAEESTWTPGTYQIEDEGFENRSAAKAVATRRGPGFHCRGRAAASQVPILLELDQSQGRRRSAPKRTERCQSSQSQTTAAQCGTGNDEPAVNPPQPHRH
jgi:hypothetical protein